MNLVPDWIYEIRIVVESKCVVVYIFFEIITNLFVFKRQAWAVSHNYVKN